MIIFDLLCNCGCQFEGWFKDKQQYLEQRDNKWLTCPSCGGDKVHKILSPVAIQRSCNSEQSLTRSETMVPTMASEQQNAFRLLQTMQTYVRENFEDVGTKLAEESLKMHYGAIKARNIRGVATPDEEKMLQEEGVELLKIPFPAEEEDVN